MTFFLNTYFVTKLKKFWITLFFLLSQTLFAQYTNIINSNRPGFSESPYSVGTKVYQLETSLLYETTDIHPTFSKSQSYGVDFLFRTSFFNEKLEFNLNLAYQNEQISFQNIFNSSYYKNGIRKLTIGAKYLIYEQKYKDKSKEIRSWVERNRFDFKRLIPTVAAYVGINTGVPDVVFVTKDFSPKAGVLLQNDLSDNFNIITNLYYDRIGTELPEFSYIVTATYSFSPRWSIFIENQTLFDKYKYQSNIGSGIAFLYNRNIQINSSIRLLADSSKSGFYSSVGVSYRFDRHVDKITKLDENGNPLKNDKGLDVKKRKFFNRLFGKVRNIFSKKSKRQASRSKKLNKETEQSIRNNTSNNINKKSDELSDPPLRVKPKRTRVKPSNIKGKKDKSKKGILNIFKRNSDENETPIKDEDKGTKDLEKEIRKLEREVKKDKAKTTKKEKKESKRLKKEKEKKESKKRKKEKKRNKEDDNNDENLIII